MRSSATLLNSAVCLLLLLSLVLVSPSEVAAFYPAGPATDKLGAYNKRVGAKFMRELHASDERILELGNTGILYRVIESGSGEVHPTRRAAVTYHRAGKTIKGRVFEDTWQRGAWPTPLALGGVLGAHQQALERMVVGDEWEIITPGAFAYDKYGARADRIGPHEVLLFKLRLLAIAPGTTSSLSDENNNDDWSVPRSWQHPVHRHPDALAADVEATRLAAALQAEHAANTERLVQEGRRAPNEAEKRAAAEQIQRLAQQAQAEEAQKQKQQQQQEQQTKQQPQPPIKVAPHGAPADVKVEL